MKYIVRPYRRGEEQYVADAHCRLYPAEYGWGPAFTEYAAKIAVEFAGAQQEGPRRSPWSLPARSRRGKPFG